MKNFLLIIATILLIGMSVINLWTLNTAERIVDAYHQTKIDYCDLFGKYDEYFSILDNPYSGLNRTEEYSRYFYFKDEFLKYCK